MVQLTKVLILASGLAVTAFSLERPVNSRINNQATSSKIVSRSKPSAAFQHSAAQTFLKSAEEASAEVVATKVEPKKSFIDLIWNENTKLSFYLAVWYLGNVYCKLF
jgi:hypothetical protein